jgi:hypothetical protein
MPTGVAKGSYSCDRHLERPYLAARFESVLLLGIEGGKKMTLVERGRLLANMLRDERMSLGDAWACLGLTGMPFRRTISARSTTLCKTFMTTST